MCSLRWHFTNKSVTGAPYSIKGYSYSLSHSWTLWWRVRWLKDWNSAVLRSRRNCSSDDSAERTDDGRAFPLDHPAYGWERERERERERKFIYQVHNIDNTHQLLQWQAASGGIRLTHRSWPPITKETIHIYWQKKSFKCKNNLVYTQGDKVIWIRLFATKAANIK